MQERTQTQPQPPTPVTADAHATTPQLLARAADDYANAHPADPDSEANG
ncbi:hypothetical protein ACWDE0_21985 [Streptomyces sp. 900105755]